MKTATKTIEQFIQENGIRLTFRAASDNPNMESSRDMDHYRVTLHHAGRRMTLTFSKGVGHHGADPEVAEVLDCLISDSWSADEDFAEFCSNMGFDEDSRKALRIYKACVSIRERLLSLLGHDLFNEALACERL
jgi:hypothetical protein